MHGNPNWMIEGLRAWVKHLVASPGSELRGAQPACFPLLLCPGFFSSETV